MDGQEVWAGAATRDIDFAFMRGKSLMTHKIAGQVDQERDKVADDIAFAGCAEAVDWWDRAQVPHLLTNATGDRMITDGRLVVVRLKECETPPRLRDDAGWRHASAAWQQVAVFPAARDRLHAQRSHSSQCVLALVRRGAHANYSHRPAP